MNFIKKLLYFILIGTLWNEAISYVLVQVRKGENKSNGDTLIHKVVPADKFDEIAEKAKKQFKNFEQYTIKNQPGDKELESIVFAIKTDENGDRRQHGGGLKMEDNALSKLINKLMGIFKKPDSRELANYRAKLKKYNIKPEVVKFKNNNGKSSMMYEIDTKSILRAFKDVLSSKKFKTYTDNIVNKAATIYRVFKEELEEAK
ncbi:unnamed protein product [Euphydryas editha]|uniref:Uncharacterized protein n=1 Tax=Euphydryas editha TaxID=104508 RepID=A0AAU9TD67_EUPED|nr:unnamed protein product [Euphydryas editha]